MTPLFCNDHANVNHCSKKNLTQLLHAVMIFGNQTQKLLLFTYGRSHLVATGPFLSRCLRESDNEHIHTVSCLEERNISIIIWTSDCYVLLVYDTVESGIKQLNCRIHHVTVPIATRILIANVRQIGLSNVCVINLVYFKMQVWCL